MKNHFRITAMLIAFVMLFSLSAYGIPSARAASPEVSELTESWWQGEWFGFWSYSDVGSENCFDYEDWAGESEDVCCIVTVENGSAELIAWDSGDYDDPMFDLFITLADSDDVSGTAEVTSGTVALDWPDRTEVDSSIMTVKTAETGYSNLISIEGEYHGESEDQYIYYELVLKRWGERWDDVSGFPSDDDINGTLRSCYSTPMTLDSFYYPMIEGGYPMCREMLDVRWALQNPLIEGDYYCETVSTACYSVDVPVGFFKEGDGLCDLVYSDAWGYTSKGYLSDIGTADNLAEHYAVREAYASDSSIEDYEAWDETTADGYTAHFYIYNYTGWGWYAEMYVDYGGDIGTGSSSYAAYIYFCGESYDDVWNDGTRCVFSSFTVNAK